MSLVQFSTDTIGSQAFSHKIHVFLENIFILTLYKERFVHTICKPCTKVFFFPHNITLVNKPLVVYDRWD